MQESKSALDIQQGGSHYKTLTIQPVEYINANNLSFFQGNVVKYTTRYKDKKGAEDLKKAIHYLQMILEFEYDVITDVSYKESPKDSYVVADKTNPLKPWVPDDSGEWKETSEEDFDTAKQTLSGRRLEVLADFERSLEQGYKPTVGTFEFWFSDCKDWGNRVAYKVCKD